VWVQLLQNKYVDIDGIQKRYAPGDWIEIGKQTALAWIADGAAKTSMPPSIEVAAGAGIVLQRNDPGAISTLAKWGVSMPAIVGEPELKYDYTLIWDPSAPLRPELLPVGFKILEKWLAAIPMLSYDKLARDMGGKVERSRTEGIIHDLRVPLYDTRMIFIKRTPKTEVLIAAWKVEMHNGANKDLAFLRALYRMPLEILALPITWTDKKGMRG